MSDFKYMKKTEFKKKKKKKPSWPKKLDIQNPLGLTK